MTDELEQLAAGVLMIGFPGKQVPAETRELIERGVKSFILFGRNIGTEEETRALTHELRALAGEDALIAIDHEGGRVNRLAGIATSWPSPMAWAATGDLDLVRDASQASARELAALGINLNFAPVVDLLVDHRNPVLGLRCFSDDPETVAACASAFIPAHQQASVAACAKHFPGHGGTPLDSHQELPRVDRSREQIQAEDLVPFAVSVDAGVDCLMVSHVWYAALDEQPTPATLSRAVVDLARRDLGFEGLIVSDCMEMGAIQRHTTTAEGVVQAITAGIDLALVSHQAYLQQLALECLIDAVRSGSLPRERLEEANRRVVALQRRARVHEGAMPPGGEDIAQEMARRAITLVRDESNIVPLRLQPDQPLGIVGFRARVTSAAEGALGTYLPEPPLAEMAARRHPNLVEIGVEEDTDVQAVLERLEGVDAAVIGTHFATGHSRQAEIVRALQAAGKQVIALALGDPFDLLSYPEIPTYLATYGNQPLMLDAAFAVLFGEEELRGHLPVELPGL